MISLSQIVRYPLKSGAPDPLANAEVQPRGLAGDRRWMVVDEGGRFRTGRELPSMVKIRAALRPGGLRLAAPGMPDLDVAEPTGGPRQAVEVWVDTVRALIAGDSASAWLSAFLGAPCRLAFMDEAARRPVDAAYARADEEVSFADGFPLLVISEGSLEDLNARLERPVTMGHFRPNLVARGCEPFAEDRWRRVQIGEAVFEAVKPCSRCVFVTVDPQTGLAEPGGEPLRTLAGYRSQAGKVKFGQNLLVVRPGRIAAGDRVIAIG